MALNLQRTEFVRSAAGGRDFPRDGLPQVVFSGRSNVGKSSVINKLLLRRNFARVGGMPGKTVHINYFLVDEKVYLVDLPGYGYAKVGRGEKRRWADLIEGYLTQDREIALVFSLMDFRHPPTRDDLMMVEFLVEQELPFVVVMTKADKLNATQRRERTQALQQELPHADQLTIIPFSSVTGEGVEEIRAIIDELEEEVLSENASDPDEDEDGPDGLDDPDQ